MQEQPPSTAVDSTVWIFLAGLLILGVAVGFISMGIMAHNQEMQAQAAAPPAAAPAPAVAPAK